MWRLNKLKNLFEVEQKQKNEEKTTHSELILLFTFEHKNYLVQQCFELKDIYKQTNHINYAVTICIIIMLCLVFSLHSV
jgi:hypothetical protein